MKKIISFFLLTVIVISFASPVASASELPASERDNLQISDGYALYSGTEGDFIYHIYLNTNLGNGNISVQPQSNTDYIYEYYFTYPVNQVYVSSDSFWNILKDDCFSHQSEWTSIFLPHAVQKISEPMTRSAPNYDSEMASYLRNLYGNPYSGALVQTKNKNGINFSLYEDMTHSVGQMNGYIITESLSVVSFISGYLGYTPVVAMIEFFTLLFKADTIPQDTSVYQYYLQSQWYKYVKKQNSSYILNQAFKTITHYAYSAKIQNSVNTGWEIYPNHTRTSFSVSETYYNDSNAQFNDAYTYYIQNYN